MNKRSAFTLIEILIVVAIIGILASIVLVGLGPIQKRGRDARKISDLRSVQNGLELYYNKNGSYPTGITQWTDLDYQLKNAQIGVSQLPKDPRSPTVDYCYATDGTTYVLSAALEDTNNSALSSSYTGTVPTGGGMADCKCTSPNYCVSL